MLRTAFFKVTYVLLFIPHKILEMLNHHKTFPLALALSHGLWLSNSCTWVAHIYTEFLKSVHYGFSPILGSNNLNHCQKKRTNKSKTRKTHISAMLVTWNTDVYLINIIRIKIMKPILPQGVHQSSGNHCQTFYHSARSTDSHGPNLQDSYTDFNLYLCQSSPYKLS